MTGPFNLSLRYFSLIGNYFIQGLLFSLIAYLLGVFVVGLISERGLTIRYRTTIISIVIAGILVGLIGSHGSICSTYSGGYCYQFAVGINRGGAYFMYDYPWIIGTCLQALLVGLTLPLLWKLPRVKRNLAEE